MERHHRQVWPIGAIGLWLIVSPFLLGAPLAEEAGAGPFRWTFVGAGSAAILLAVGRLSSSPAWKAALAAAVGAWLIISPWLVGFASSQGAVWSAVLPGAAILALGVWSFTTSLSARAF